MPTERESQSATRSIDIGRTALLILLVAPLAGAIWWFAPDNLKPLPMGQTEARLRAHVAELYGVVGTREAATSCQYWAKHLYLTCEPSRELAAALHKQLLSSGWRADPTAFSATVKNSYSKERDTASLACQAPPGGRCTFSLFAPR